MVSAVCWVMGGIMMLSPVILIAAVLTHDMHGIEEVLIPFGVFFFVTVVLFLISIFVGQEIQEREKRERDRVAKEAIVGGRWITAEEFESNWIVGMRDGKGGYKPNDGPGCYVILIYDKEPQQPGKDPYDEVYIGQSINMCQRVRNHLSGRGNSDVYADRRMGKCLYVHFEPCERPGLNALEKRLIALFDATDSYNKTRGGA